VSPGGQERPPVALVGSGRAARRLALALTSRRWPLAGIAARSPERAATLAADVQAPALGSLDAPAPGLAGAPIVVLAVSDEAIPVVAASLAKAAGPWPARVALHLSGLLPSTALEPLRVLGASAASWHPLATLGPAADPADRIGIPSGVPFFIEGDAAACDVARRLTLALEGDARRLEGAADKAIYHAAATLAGNLVAVLHSEAAALLGSVGVQAPERALAPLAQASLGGAIAHPGLEALTGPVVRGDVATLRSNARALADRPPELRLAHAALSLLALRRVRDWAGRDAASDDAMESLLREVVREAAAASSSGRLRE